MSKTMKIFLLLLAGFAILLLGPIVLLINELIIPLGIIGIFGGFNDNFKTDSVEDYSEVMEYYYYGSLAPGSLDGLKVERFEFEYESKLLSSSFEFLLEIKYGSAEEYQREVTRLSDKIKNSGIEDAIVGESEYFSMPACVAQWNDFYTFEYALFDEADLTVYYIELDASGEVGRVIDAHLLPKDLGQIVDNCENPSPYSIYNEFDEREDEIEQGKDDYNKVYCPITNIKKIAI